MHDKGMENISKIKERRAQLIELSQQAREYRKQRAAKAKSIEEAAFWSSRTINFILLNCIYSETEGVEFNTFNQWKGKGATVKKGAKAVVIWGQPKHAGKDIERQIKEHPDRMPSAEPTPEEYDFYPLCFLFSEKDVHITKAQPDEQTQQAEHQATEEYEHNEDDYEEPIDLDNVM